MESKDSSSDIDHVRSIRGHLIPSRGKGLEKYPSDMSSTRGERRVFTMRSTGKILSSLHSGGSIQADIIPEQGYGTNASSEYHMQED